MITEQKLKAYRDYKDLLDKEDKLNTKCFAGTYKRAVSIVGGAPHGGLVCYGGFDQPPCEHLVKCIEQFKSVINEKKFNRMIKRFSK